MHCFHSWKHFYYGFQLGVMYLKTSLDTNTYRDKPTYSVPAVQVLFAEFAGARFALAEDLWFHIEIGGLIPEIGTSGGEIAYETFGLNYCIDTRNKMHVPVKIDPDLIPKPSRHESAYFPETKICHNP